MLSGIELSDDFVLEQSNVDNWESDFDVDIGEDWDAEFALIGEKESHQRVPSLSPADAQSRYVFAKATIIWI